MKIFLDTANLEQIKKWMPTGLVDGITTNPSHLSKEGPATKELLLEISRIVPGEVSVEVVKKDPQEVYQQAKEIAELGKNIVVKIPFALEYLSVIDRLTKEGIRINVTLIFSLLQALCAAKLGVAYISPFIGRLDDIDVDGVAIVAEIVDMVAIHGFSSQVLSASVRHVMHFHKVLLAGSDVATIPPSLFERLIKHPLTEQGMKKFDQDWQQLGKKDLLS